MMEFLKAIWKDERIPLRDKRIHLILAILVLSPFDLIPDYLAWYGLLDDLIYFTIIGDYYFNLLDSRVLLSLYPSSLKNFNTLKRIFLAFSFILPKGFMNGFWEYKPEIY